MHATYVRHSLLSVVVAAIVAAVPIGAVLLVCSDDPASELLVPSFASSSSDLDHH